MNHYELLGIQLEATEKEVRKAFRIKSLLCHPDKAGDDLKAAEMFHAINVAVDTLTDMEKRRLYDVQFIAEQQRKKRFYEMNEARQDSKIKLEAREQEAKKAKMALSKEAMEKIEIERIREEGINNLLARQEIRRQETASSFNLAQELKVAADGIKQASVADCSIKLKWSKDNQNFTEIGIREIMNKYGELETILMSKSGKRAATVVFKKVDGAVRP